MLRPEPYVTKYDGRLEEARLEELQAAALTPSELDRVERRELAWRGAAPWAINAEMERNVSCAAARRRERRRRAAEKETAA